MNDYIEDALTGEKFEFLRVLKNKPGVFDKEARFVSFRFSHCGDYKKDSWERIDSPAERLSKRIYELKGKKKLFKWVQNDKAINFFRITTWRRNKYDFVADGSVLTDNLEIMELIEKMK